MISKLKALTTSSLGIICAVQLLAQEGVRLQRVTVSGPRPLAKAAELLEHKYGLLINYEDPILEHASDLEDRTAANAGSKAGTVVLLPRGGNLEFELQVTVTDSSRLKTPTRDLDDLVRAYSSRGFPGAFRVVAAPGRFDLVPTRARAPDGTVRTISSPLDARLSLPAREVSGYEAIRALCEQLTVITTRRVVVGNVPMSLLAKSQVILKAQNEIAREALSSVLQQLRVANGQTTTMGPKLAWWLLFDPTMRYYVLNLHVAMKESPSRFYVGRTELRPQ